MPSNCDFSTSSLSFGSESHSVSSTASLQSQLQPHSGHAELEPKKRVKNKTGWNVATSDSDFSISSPCWRSGPHVESFPNSSQLQLQQQSTTGNTLVEPSGKFVKPSEKPAYQSMEQAQKTFEEYRGKMLLKTCLLILTEDAWKR